MGPALVFGSRRFHSLHAINPNSIVDMSYYPALSSGSSPHLAFANSSLIPFTQQLAIFTKVSVVTAIIGKVTENKTKSLQTLSQKSLCAKCPQQNLGLYSMTWW
ncbi:hypothetical protein BT96DRAFT_1008752 [Gymnopus androsaceus JB14]|uniref:Uncharacterized protein n=1 Tax=Gymnopus androsaceus JB14 TaxID=1447944 RepID=A0A6A4GEE0_9AGAR|nr:hypothetical protein BT96DRAFT_1008752 [Gymnopus androsaceus JB14]